MKSGRNKKCTCNSGKKYRACCGSSTFSGDYAQKPLKILGGTAVIDGLRSAFEAYHPMNDDGLRNVLVELKQGTIIVRPSLAKPEDVLVLAMNEGTHLVVRHCHDLDSVKNIAQQLRKDLPSRKTVVLAEDEEEYLSAQLLRRVLLQDKSKQ